MRILPSTLLSMLLITLLTLFFLPIHAESSPTNTAKTDPNLDLKFVTIPAGQFVMGTTDLAKARADLPDPKAAMIDDEAPAHTVTFKKSFQMSQTEVTQKVWLDIMGTQPGLKAQWQVKNWQQLPVVSVSWNRIADFINELNQTSTNRASTNKHYRLPTEAEWEYAARAGDTGLRPFSKLAMDEDAWYINSSNDEIQAVGQLKANAWGLHDMYGNVWEWVADWYSPDTYKKQADSKQASINPQGPNKGTKKIRRGGSFHCPPHLIRSAYRAADNPERAYSVLGFRLVAEEPITKELATDEPATEKLIDKEK